MMKLGCSAGDASHAPAVRVWHVSNAAQVLRSAAQPHLPAVGRVQRWQSLRLQSAEPMLADVPPLMIKDCLSLFHY